MDRGRKQQREGGRKGRKGKGADWQRCVLPLPPTRTQGEKVPTASSGTEEGASDEGKEEYHGAPDSRSSQRIVIHFMRRSEEVLIVVRRRISWTTATQRRIVREERSKKRLMISFSALFVLDCVSFGVWQEEWSSLQKRGAEWSFASSKRRCCLWDEWRSYHVACFGKERRRMKEMKGMWRGFIAGIE